MTDDVHDDSRIRSVLDGRYRIDARIATGGMGALYRGERVGIGKPVAIKFLHRSAARDPAHRQRFEREAMVMARVAHPNVVSVIDHGVEAGVPYLVMDFQTGESLRTLMRRGPVAPRRAVAIARQIASGVGGIHAAGVAHRDLKPENVLLLAGLDHDFVKVLDFGIAKIFDGDSAIDVTRAGHVVGTPSYMSPEQARAAAVDARTDIYSLGVILFELVTGERLFTGDEGLAILRQHVEVAPRSPRASGAPISEALDAVILRALAKSPDERYQTTSELAAALAETPESQPEPEPVRRSRRGGVLGILFAAALGVGIGWLARDPRVVDRFSGRGPRDAAAAADAIGMVDATVAADARRDAATIAIDAPPAIDAAPAALLDAPAVEPDAPEPDAGAAGSD